MATPSRRFEDRIYQLFALITERIEADGVCLVLRPDPIQPGELILTARVLDRRTQKPVYPEWGTGDLQESLEDLAKELGLIRGKGVKDA